MTLVKSREEIIRRLNTAVRLNGRWTQKEIAERAGLEGYTLNKILKGSRTLTAYDLVRISAALEITVEEFLYEND
jgi:transcriptional regulator with XRE-family HTH domain